MSGARDLARVEHLVDLRRWEEATRHLTALLAEEPDNGHLLGLQARVLLGQDRDAEALEAADRTVAADPDEEWGHRLRSVALQRLGQPQAAARAAWRAVQLAPFQWETHARYAHVAEHPYDGRPTAWDAAVRAVELAPHEPGAHFAVGQVAAQRLDHDTAVRAFRQVLALDPTHAGAVNNLTVLESRTNLVRSARGVAETLRLDPQEPDFHANVDWVVSRFLLHVYSAAVVALVLGVALSRVGSGPPGRSLGTVLVATVLGVAVAVYSLVVWRAVPSGFRRYAVDRTRRSGGLVYLVVVALVVTAAVVWVCLVPGGAADGTPLLRTVGIGAVIGIVVHLSSRRG